MNISKKTKIVATIGPVTESIEMMEKLYLAGANVFRLNFSHGNHQEHSKRIENARNLFKEKGYSIAMMLDTKGPEIRTHEFVDGSATIIKDSIVRISMKEVLGTAEKFSITYSDLINDIKVGNKIKINDGLLTLTVKEIDKANQEIVTVAFNTCVIKNRRGINVPFVKIRMPFISNKDREDIEFACDQNITYIATSFTRTKEDILEVRKILSEKGKEKIQLIAKIENQEGVDNLESILEVVDGVMVARGDLGVEVPPEEVPVIQKRIIQACLMAGKPVITATQMLDSMQKNPNPTRAEVSDVANAVLETTDAVMLSGETASGDYPVESVEMQAKIAERMEELLDYEKLAITAYDYSKKTLNDAIGVSVASTANTIDAALIIALTASGATARRISNYHPKCPIIAASDNLEVCLGLSLEWGVYSTLIDYSGLTIEQGEVLAYELANKLNVAKGRPIILTGGTSKGSTDYMKVLVAK